MLLTDAEEIEWAVRTSPDLDPDKAMADPVWRIANRYTILTDDGKAVRFKPNPQQRAVIWAIFVRGWLRIIIPKARQLGMSTLLAIIALDGVLWREGYQAALIDKTRDDAVKKHREKVMFAWERLDPYEKGALIEKKATTSMLIIGEKPKKGINPPDSSFTATIDFRGGTLEMAWISEWGAIQDSDRQQSIDIATGVLPAVERAPKGLCVIETTWRGGLEGEVGKLVTEALGTPDDAKGPKSWRILFFPWYHEPKYTSEEGYIDAASAAYFRECAKRGLTFTEGQMRWYAGKRRTAPSIKKVKEEYPTFMEECWENVPEGSIYGEYIENARAEGRIVNYLSAHDYPVHTFHDIGAPVNTATWLAQITPYEVRLVDVLFDVEMTTIQRATWLKSLGWEYGNHYFPHDTETATNTEGETPIQHYRQIYGPTCRVVPRTHLIWTGISSTQANFSRFKFRCDTSYQHDPKKPFPIETDKGPQRMKIAMDWLSRYRFIRETVSGTIKNEPVHDRYSHLADALRQLGQTLANGRVEHANHVGGRDGYAESRPRQLVVRMAGHDW